MMKRRRYTLCQEPMICRLPALFPFIEWNDVGVASLRSATEALSQGSYGKVIPNLNLNGTVWSYRDLISGYNNDTLPTTTKSLVTTAIGKKSVVWEGLDRKVTDLVPEYIYLAAARESLQDMRNMKYMVNLYEVRLECMEEGQSQCNNESNADMCCLKDKYERMGGEDYITFLEACVEEADAIAETMKDYAVFDGDGSLRIMMNVPILKSNKDMGVVRPLIKPWVVGEQYYPGQFVIYDGVLYHVNENIDGSPVNGTLFNTTTERSEFNSSVFTAMEDYAEEDGAEIASEWWELYCKNRVGYDATVGDRVVCQGESQLTALRMYGTYINTMGVEETPEKGVDWLYYYRQGIALNVQCEMDDLGNILTIDGDVAKETDGKSLYAFGDIINSIVLDKENSTITINYSIGVHLVNIVEKWKTDDDGNDLYRVSDEWKVDKETELTKYGVDYSETFKFTEDSDLADIEESDFQDYVEGEIEDRYTKYEFITSDLIVGTDRDINGVKVSLDSQIAQLGFNIRPTSYDIVPFVRDEYCLGVSYPPTEDTDVYIQRGNASAFEKHIKLSEIRTMDDMLKCATLPIVSTNVVEK